MLPSPPSDVERSSYVSRHLLALTAASVLGFTGMALSLLRFSLQGPWTMLFLLPVGFMIVSFCISQVSNSFTPAFDLVAHERLVAAWQPARHPSVDVFLPTCGEDMELLRNTAEWVARLEYPGTVTVYSLDDANRAEVATLAAEFGFVYLSRPDRGWFKKAGNLRYGYEHSSGEFVVVFDADFAPRPDFLANLLPYFDAEPDLGIVQSPQYFRVDRSMNWIERGAGAVQEYFYRISLISRQARGAAICVGTNAVYRRAALDSNGGTTLIEHSEDVHTGFDLLRRGWRLRYIPVVLAAGICPANLAGFFAQQYRWCMGSMSLLSSPKFWLTKLRVRQRLCYINGFCYYIETAFLTFVGPLVPLTMIYVFPEHVHLSNYVLLIPGAIYAFVVFPLWHRCRYSFAAWSTKMVYGWAHLFAISDKLRGKPMGWAPTLGRRSNANRSRFRTFQMGLVLWGGGTCTLWMVGSLDRLRIGSDPLAWLPMIAIGAVYTASIVRILIRVGHEAVFERNLVRRTEDQPAVATRALSDRAPHAPRVAPSMAAAPAPVLSRSGPCR